MKNYNFEFEFYDRIRLNLTQICPDQDKNNYKSVFLADFI